MAEREYVLRTESDDGIYVDVERVTEAQRQEILANLPKDAPIHQLETSTEYFDRIG